MMPGILSITADIINKMVIFNDRWDHLEVFCKCLTQCVLSLLRLLVTTLNWLL